MCSQSFKTEKKKFKVVYYTRVLFVRLIIVFFHQLKKQKTKNDGLSLIANTVTERKKKSYKDAQF